MKSSDFIFVPGFLGQMADGEELFETATHSPICVTPTDLLSDAQDLDCAGKILTQFAAQKGIKKIMGYSLGGRLALHALVNDKTGHWESAIIISAHPGLETVEQRQARTAQDQLWAKRFRNDPWSEVLRDWNQQAVFGGTSFPLHRDKNEASKLSHAEVMERFSLGSQRDLRLEMKNIRAGVLFVSGSRDNKFCELAKIMQENTPRSSLRIFENAGHRVPWDVVDFKNVALEFFNKGDGSESRVDAHKKI